jgi:hypothetical protein
MKHIEFIKKMSKSLDTTLHAADHQRGVGEVEGEGGEERHSRYRLLLTLYFIHSFIQNF